MRYRVELIGGPADGQIVESDWAFPESARWSVPVQVREESMSDLYLLAAPLSQDSGWRSHHYGPGIITRRGRHYLTSEHIRRA